MIVYTVNMGDDNIKVFGYARVSTETQAEKGYGLEDQQKGILAHLQDKGCELVGEFFIDAGQSGAHNNLQADLLEDALEHRTALLDMLDRLDEVQAVVVLNTSRLWREEGTKFFIQRALRRKQVDVISVEQPTYTLYDDSPTNKFMNTIQEAMDVFERDGIRLKLARARTTKAEHGDKPAGVTPYGYCYDFNHKAVSIQEQEAPLIKKIYSMAQRGQSLQQIADALNASGLRTRRGCLWSKPGLHKICTNDFYTGVLTHQKKKRKGNHPAIISKVQFGKVRAQLERRRKITP